MIELGAAFLCLLLCGAAAIYVMRSKARLQERELQIQEDAQDAQDLLGAARDFAIACRISAREVRRELDNAVRSRVPSIDAVAFFAIRNQRLACVYATKDSRLERYEGNADYEFDHSESRSVALPVAAAIAKQPLMAGATIAEIHPADRHALAVPLILDKGNVGVLYVASSSTPFLEAIPAIELIASHAEPSIIIAEEREQMSAQTMHDAKTGLLSENPFRERFAEELARAQRSGTSLALVYIDLDHFKAWNDAYGHASGDLVIIRAGEILRSMKLTARDIVARLHGDEFVIAFLDADKTDVVARAKEIGAAIFFDDRADLLPPDNTDPPLAISASIGVVAFPRDAKTEADLLEQADRVMYKAKVYRDRVAFYDDDGEIQTVQPSLNDRRNPESRPNSDRRVAGREFSGVGTAANGGE